MIARRYYTLRLLIGTIQGVIFKSLDVCPKSVFRLCLLDLFLSSLASRVPFHLVVEGGVTRLPNLCVPRFSFSVVLATAL
jgi:hypothetical protein